MSSASVVAFTRSKRGGVGRAAEAAHAGEQKEASNKDRTYASSTLEDIRIFEEWLRASNRTIAASRLLHQGLIFLFLCYAAWASAHGVAALSYDAQRPTWVQLIYRFHPAILTAAWLYFVSGGAYHRRVRMAGTHLQRLNGVLAQFSVTFCGESGRLRILRKTGGSEEETPLS